MSGSEAPGDRVKPCTVEELGELVHEAKSREATGINNEGPCAQVRYLLDYGFSKQDIEDAVGVPEAKALFTRMEAPR